MLIEEYIREMIKSYGDPGSADMCVDVAKELLDSTSHLVKVSSVAKGVGVCVFIARLIEVMGVRGLYRSVLPGKGTVTHQLLAVAFPRVLDEVIRRGSAADLYGVVEKYVEEAFNELSASNALYSASPGAMEAAVKDAVTMAVNGVSFVMDMASRFEVDLWKAHVYTELPLMSYNLHMWGVADVIVEDPDSKSALIIEWKSYRVDQNRAPTVGNEDILQAYGYALLEADRLGYSDPRDPILDGRIGVAVVRPVEHSRAIRYYMVYPRGACTANKCWRRGELNRFLDAMIVLAEHLALVLASRKKVAEKMGTRWEIIERLCSIRTRRGKPRAVFNRIPMHPILQRRMSNPMRRGSTWPCNACHYRDACEYYVFSGREPEYVELRRRAWKTRYSVMAMRENALHPYHEVRRVVFMRKDTEWVRLGADTRILSDGNRVDLFDEALVEEDGVVLQRRPMWFEEREDVIITLREGKPVAVFFNERHIADPLLRLSFYGTVTESRYDESIDRVVVRVEPASPPSRIYIPLLKMRSQRKPDLFRNVLALEVNVELAHLELLAIDAYERGTYKALKEGGPEEDAEKALALILGGLGWDEFIKKR